MSVRKVLVTGGAGFIGSAVCRHLIGDLGWQVVNVDKLTYAADLHAVEAVSSSPGYAFEKADICDRVAISEILQRHQPDAIMHLAAESHVDRSIEGPEAFITTNILGTYRLLESTLEYWKALPEPRREAFRFLHVSTDEVYGSLGDTGEFHEETPYAPNSPYSASKAASDHLARAWHHTYGLPTLLSNCSNNYGPFQFPEKLIPLMILNAVHGKPLPVYGNGQNRRDWLFVEDHARALALILDRGRVGEKYNVGGNAEHPNLDIVHTICDLVDELRGGSGKPSVRHLIRFVEDRLGHDWRYAIDATKLTTELGWRPSVSLNEGLRRTVQWYLSRVPA